MEKSEFDQVVKDKWAYLTKVAEGICGFQDAEDAVVEAVSYVWEHREFDNVDKALIGRTRHRATDILRANDRRAEIEVPLPDAENEYIDYDDDGEQIDRSHERVGHVDDTWAYQTPSTEDVVLAEEAENVDIHQLPIMVWARRHVPQTDLAVFLALNVDDVSAGDIAAEYGYSRQHVYVISNRVAAMLQKAAKQEGLL